MQFQLISIAFLLQALVVFGISIFSGFLLRREKGMGPLLMIAGGCLGLLGLFGSFLQTFHRQILSSVFGGSGFNSYFWAIPAAISSFGALLSAIGLLLFVLSRERIQARVNELEAILADRDRRDGE